MLRITMRFCTAVAALVAFAVLSAPGAEREIPKEPPSCKRCYSNGFLKCPECNGVGKGIDKARLTCPKCKGQKTAPCRRCNATGKISCPERHAKEENGKWMIVNPAHAEWKEQMAAHLAGKKDRRGYPVGKPGAEPPEFVVCPRCGGGGKISCPDCDGTGKMACPKCKGKGYVMGDGPCYACNGSGRAPCPDCAVLPEGSPEETQTAMRATEAKWKQGKLRDLEYFKERRNVVWDAKVFLIKKMREERMAKMEEERRKREEAMQRREEAENRKRAEALQKMAMAFEKGEMPLAEYEKRRFLFGLDREEVLAAEKRLGETEGNDRIRAWVELRERFRNGEIDRDEYDMALEKL